MATQAQGTEGQDATAAKTGTPDTQTALLKGKSDLLGRIRAGDTERAGRDESQRAATGADATAVAAGSNPAPATTDKPKTETAPAAGHGAEIAELKAQIAALAARLAEPAKPKEEPATVEDKYAALVERIKADPGAVFDEFGDAISIEKLSEAHLRRTDNPAHKELTAHEKEIADLKSRLNARDQADKDAATKTETEAREKAGRDVVKSLVDSDKGRWARVARSEENTAEAIAEAVTAGRKVVVELRKTKGATYSPSEEEAKAILQDCLDAIEKDFGARATRYGAPDIAPRNAAPAPMARKTIPMTTPASGGTRPPPEEPKPAKGDLMTEKAALVRRVRQASRQTAE